MEKKTGKKRFERLNSNDKHLKVERMVIIML